METDIYTFDCLICGETVHSVDAADVCAQCQPDAMKCALCGNWEDESNGTFEPEGRACDHFVCHPCAEKPEHRQPFLRPDCPACAKGIKS